MMKAIAFTYKTTEAQPTEVKKPKPGPDEVLVKVHSAALDTGLDPVIQKTTTGSFLHKFTNPLLCGWHYSGTIDHVGTNVNDFKVGDEVFGHLPFRGDTEQGSLAEYVAVKADSCGMKPTQTDHNIAAAATVESLTALQGLRDHGGLVYGGKNQSVLVNGAAGGVGLAAIQIAKRMGATVTAICSTKDVERIKKLGVSVVVDRKKTPDVLSELKDARFDVVFDTPSVLPVAKTLRFLKPKGNYVLTAPHFGIWWGAIVAFFSGKGVKMFIVESRKTDLDQLGLWLEGGIELDVDSIFPIKKIEDAAARNRHPSKKGRVVVQVDNGW